MYQPTNPIDGAGLTDARMRSRLSNADSADAIARFMSTDASMSFATSGTGSASAAQKCACAVSALTTHLRATTSDLSNATRAIAFSDLPSPPLASWRALRIASATSRNGSRRSAACRCCISRWLRGARKG